MLGMEMMVKALLDSVMSSPEFGDRLKAGLQTISTFDDRFRRVEEQLIVIEDKLDAIIISTTQVKEGYTDEQSIWASKEVLEDEAISYGAFKQQSEHEIKQKAYEQMRQNRSLEVGVHQPGITR